MMLALALVIQYLMSRTAFFRQYYYIGANEKAATLSGRTSAACWWPPSRWTPLSTAREADRCQ
jgi:ABC-type uncharacterized transport system permease subunit